MFEEQLLEIHENSGIQGFLTKPLFESRLKLYTFGFFGKLFKLKYSRKIKQRHQFTLETTVNLILMLQLISLTWYPNYKISGWESYSLFWKILGIVSYDELCFEYGAQDICFYGTIGLIGTCIICFVVFGVFIYIKKEPPGIITALPRKITMALTTICFIPSQIIMLMVFKYSVATKREVIEYENSTRSQLDYGAAGGMVSIILCIFLLLIKFFSEIFSCDVRHSRSKENIKARCCSDADLNRFAFYALNCLLYVSLGDYQIEYQIISFSISTYVFFQTLNYLPYYNFIENSIQAVKLSAISGFLLIFLFGELLDNSLIILWMNIFIQPLIFYFVIKIVKHLYKNLNKEATEIKNQYEFERKFRHLLVDKALIDKSHVLDLFAKFSKGKQFYRSKLFVVWEFNFCLYIIKDERLARVKLAKIGEIPSTFEGDAQEWRLFNWLIDKKCSNFPDTNYLEYLTELNRVKTKDEELCCILVELKAEFSSKVPRLLKLLNLANQIHCHIEEIKEEYKNIVEKYKNIDAFELYGSFLENILKDHEEALMVNRKKHGINLFNMRGEDKKLEKYGKENATLLISASNTTFGSIVFLNEKAAQILKTSINDACGLPFTNFIPPPYNGTHEKSMKKYFFNCQNIDIPFHKSLPFLTRNGYIKECNILVKLTAFHNHAYFLLSFKEKYSSREVALISEDGRIYCHSEFFTFLIGIEAPDVRNKYISELLPMLDFYNMEPFEPWLLPFEGKELAVIHTVRKMNSITLHFLLLVHDEKEVKRWKEGQDFDQIEFFGNSTIIDDYDEPSQIMEKRLIRQASKVRLHTVSQYITSVSKSTIKEESEMPTTQLTILAAESRELETFDEKSGATSNNESHKLSAKARHAQRLIISSKMKIRFLQLVLFFTILSVIIGVIAILSYMVIDVSHTTPLTIFTHLGQLLYDLSISSDLARILHKEIVLGLYKQTNRLADVQALITDLRSVQEFIFSDYDQWSYCSSSEVVMKPIIPAWNLDKDQPELIKENLYNIVDKFILNWENLIVAVNRNESYIKFVKYIVINSVDFSYEYANLTMKGLVDCEIERVNSFGTNIKALLICGMWVLVGFFAIIIGYVIMADRSYNAFWNFMLNNSQVSLIQLKREAIDRLFSYHGIDYKSEILENDQKNMHKHSKIKTGLNRKYILKVMIFVVIALSYYFLMYCYLYAECENSMIKRPKLLSNFNIRRALLARISFFAKDIYTPYLYQNFKDLYGFSNSYTMLSTSIALLDEKMDEMQKEKYQNLMSNKLLDRIYEKIDSSVRGLDYGSAAANHAALFDARYITKMFPPNNTFMIIYINFIHKIEDEIGSQFILVDENSKDLINSQLANIIICTVCYSIALCFLFFFYYFPYLNNEIRQFSRLLVLPLLLPMEESKRMQIGKDK
ncbi:unnamed protein product [Blepharisma stoltei]|uniref:TmcB/TmcC TPR repeats domain-containing protein n=1 Tax=Blepharisma stoltei TaxID=1481888 RepID=A0AAU9J3C9_9CILI|nr:unnamed protein product [Blepharisma stoltei]